MFRHLRLMIAAVLFAALGAVAGRVVADIRRQQAAGETPHLYVDRITVRPRDIAPGVVAAMRVSGPPWSWLHVPPWMAAFGVNFAIAAFGGEFASLGLAGGGDLDPVERAESAYPWSAAAPPSADAGLSDSAPGGEFTAFSQ